MKDSQKGSTKITRAPKETWECNFPADLGNHDRPIKQLMDLPTNMRVHREVTLSKLLWHID